MPVVTSRYVCGNNRIDLGATYTQIKNLLTHSQCVHQKSALGGNEQWPCRRCENAFLDMYWSSAALLLDYFADFLATDTPLMRSVWFHLLDIWQEGAMWLPYQEVLDTLDTRDLTLGNFRRAKIFQEHFRETIELFETTIFGVKGRAVSGDTILYSPSGETNTPAGDHETGPWISGLKPWQQFLYEGSPGVAADAVSLNIPEENSRAGRIRYIPMSAIGVVKKHTERARSLAAKLAEQGTDTAVEMVGKFDQTALAFPAALQSRTYTSLNGQTMSYRLTNGAPPVVRYVGFGDPSMLVDKPTLTLLDECVGVCKGVEAYEARSGYQAGEGYDEEAFDMWALYESEWEDGGGGSVRARAVDGWTDMFEYWCGDEEVALKGG